MLSQDSDRVDSGPEDSVLPQPTAVGPLSRSMLEMLALNACKVRSSRDFSVEALLSQMAEAICVSLLHSPLKAASIQ